MPEFLVAFDRPVWYQPDHPKARRETQAVIANAPTPQAALTHAIRVTRGEGEITQVYPIEEAPEALVAIARAVFTLPMVIDQVTGLRTALQPDTAVMVAAPEVTSGA